MKDSDFVKEKRVLSKVSNSQRGPPTVYKVNKVCEHNGIVRQVRQLQLVNTNVNAPPSSWKYASDKLQGAMEDRCKLVDINVLINSSATDVG